MTQQSPDSKHAISITLRIKTWKIQTPLWYLYTNLLVPTQAIRFHFRVVSHALCVYWARFCPLGNCPTDFEATKKHQYRTDQSQSMHLSFSHLFHFPLSLTQWPTQSFVFRWYFMQCLFALFLSLFHVFQLNFGSKWSFVFFFCLFFGCLFLRVLWAIELMPNCSQWRRCNMLSFRQRLVRVHSSECWSDCSFAPQC